MIKPTIDLRMERAFFAPFVGLNRSDAMYEIVPDNFDVPPQPSAAVRNMLANDFHDLKREQKVRRLRGSIMCGSYDVNSRLDAALDRMIDRERISAHGHAKSALDRLTPAPLTDGFVPDDYWPTDELA